MDTKDNDGNPLMTFVIKMIHKKYQSLEKLPSELSHIKESSNISLTDLTSRTQLLNGEFNLFQKRVEEIRGNLNNNNNNDTTNGSSNQLFINEMSKFTETTKEKMKQLNDDLAEVDTKYKDLLTYFGTKNMQTPSEEFFFRMSKFIEDFKATLAQLIAAERKLLDDNKKRENIGKKIGGGVGGDGDDPMSGIIAAIRAGKSSDLKKAEIINSNNNAPKEINFKAGLRASQNRMPANPTPAPSNEPINFKANLRKVAANDNNNQQHHSNNTNQNNEANNELQSRFKKFNREE